MQYSSSACDTRTARHATRVRNENRCFGKNVTYDFPQTKIYWIHPLEDSSQRVRATSRSQILQTGGTLFNRVWTSVSKISWANYTCQHKQYKNQKLALWQKWTKMTIIVFSVARVVVILKHPFIVFIECSSGKKKNLGRKKVSSRRSLFVVLLVWLFLCVHVADDCPFFLSFFLDG